jgi:hypothetical protein
VRRAYHWPFAAIVSVGCGAQEWSFDDDGGLTQSADGRAGGEGGPAGDAQQWQGGCKSERECSHVGLHCLTTAGQAFGRCVPCVDSTQCADMAFPRCDPTLNRCVECDVNSDCHLDEVCLSEPVHSCIPSCAGQRRCPPRAGACNQQRMVCLECQITDDCRVGQVCDRISGRCVECSEDADCLSADSPRCDRTAGRCVQCLRNMDCGDGLCSPFGTCL